MLPSLPREHGVSTGADRKANTRGLVRAPSGLLERLQCRVALEALSESGGSFGPEAVVAQTASMGAEVGAEACQGALTRKQTLQGGGALQRGHGAPLEPLAELGDALGGVGAVAITIDTAELVAGQTAKEGGVSTGADTKASRRLGQRRT